MTYRTLPTLINLLKEEIMNINLNTINVCIMIFYSMLIISCSESGSPEKEIGIDYSNKKNWLVCPENSPKKVDIFYVYPTAWYKEIPSEPDICEIDNKTMLTGSRKAYEIQATAFETAGNIYAPYYRQLDAKYTLTLSEEQRWNVVAATPAKDVTAAFDYYIKNYNNGRPFVLLGHSQGAHVLLILLKDYMSKNPSVFARMVCAYVIGYPVTAEFMNANKHLKFAEGADDLGVIISYNTQSPKVVSGANIVMGNNIGMVINPVNWKRDETMAGTSESFGSYMPVNSQGQFGLVPNFADARIDLAKGVLICSSVKDSTMFKLSGGMGLGIYHSFDIPFYYYNLRENVQRRVNKFLGL